MLRGRHRLLVGAIVLLLSGCLLDPNANKPKLAGPLQGSNLTASLDGKKTDALGDPFIRAGLKALEQGDYVAAQAGFGRALKFDPTNSQLHFLNGLTYHLRASAGDSSQKEYAAIGYRLALQYDSANYWAAYQLGHINFSDQRYREAQDAFAYALLFAPKEPVLLKALATASYYAQDIETAAGAIAKVEKLTPSDPQVLRLAALTSAAGKGFERADGYLERYRKTAPPGGLRRADYVARRITDWRGFHARNANLELAQSTSDILGDDNTSTGLAAPSGGDSSDSDSDSSDSSSDAKTPKQMTMVDVVIIRSEERTTTDKGVNLLNGLSAVLGGTTFALSAARTANDAGTGANTLVNSFTYAPTLTASATYALNIANDLYDNNEVLARPSLVALDGKKSEFFTGSVWHIQIAGGAGSAGSVQDVPVGIRLEVTPKFIAGGQVQLKVDAARAFIEGNSANPSFTTFAQITKTLVTANVVMKFGDTMIISGLSEKETERLDNGVPLLQDIPVIQYLFSHEDTLNFTKSVLILLTPRKPRYTHADGSAKADRAKPVDVKAKQPNLDELKGRPDWFKPAPNLDAVFQHLKDHRLFKEFRTGDVRLETWNEEFGLGLRIKRAVDFLYF